MMPFQLVKEATAAPWNDTELNALTLTFDELLMKVVRIHGGRTVASNAASVPRVVLTAFATLFQSPLEADDALNAVFTAIVCGEVPEDADTGPCKTVAKVIATHSRSWRNGSWKSEATAGGAPIADDVRLVALTMGLLPVAQRYACRQAQLEVVSKSRTEYSPTALLKLADDLITEASHLQNVAQMQLYLDDIQLGVLNAIIGEIKNSIGNIADTMAATIFEVQTPLADELLNQVKYFENLNKLVNNADFSQPTIATLLQLTVSKQGQDFYKGYKRFKAIRNTPTAMAVKTGRIMEVLGRTSSRAVLLAQSAYETKMADFDTVITVMSNLMAVQLLFRALKPGESRRAMALRFLAAKQEEGFEVPAPLQLRIRQVSEDAAA